LTVADFYTERRFIEITTAMSNINEQIEQEREQARTVCDTKGDIK